MCAAAAASSFEGGSCKLGNSMCIITNIFVLF